MQDPDLWHRIASHTLPEDGDGQSFLDQLRRDQGISVATARRGIKEYRRFLYLSATGPGHAVPTKAVDVVWHLHMSHTQDYWDTFVPDILDGRAIHHTPDALWGSDADFEQTLDRYRTEFGEEPPQDIWRRPRGLQELAGGMLAGGMAAVLIWNAVLAGAPLLFAVFGFLIFSVVLLAAMAPVLSDHGISVGIGVDIWSDMSDGDQAADGGG